MHIGCDRDDRCACSFPRCSRCWVLGYIRGRRRGGESDSFIEEERWGIVGLSEGGAIRDDVHWDIMNIHKKDLNNERTEKVELVLEEELEGTEPASFTWLGETTSTFFHVMGVRLMTSRDEHLNLTVVIAKCGLGRTLSQMMLLARYQTPTWRRRERDTWLKRRNSFVRDLYEPRR